MIFVEEDIVLISVLENIYGISAALLLLCSFFYVRQLKKLRRERKLTPFEFAMYIIIRILIFLWVGSFLLLEFGI